MRVERCTIFIMEIGSNRICSMFGTGLEEIRIVPPMDGSVVGRVISTGKSVIDNDLTSHQGYHIQIAEQTGFACHSMLCSPIKAKDDNQVFGAVQLLNKLDRGVFSEDDRLQLEEVAYILSTSIKSTAFNQEILHIADFLGQEVDRLGQSSVRGKLFIAESPAMREVLHLVKVVSTTPINVMILGENGTGKELIARMIHEQSARKTKPFVPVNCACIPESLVESEFFGHERGAFTGADSSRKGKFEDADSGTLFLDEIAEMPLTVQPKILRALEEQEGQRLGGNKTISYDLRLICATNKDISVLVKKGLFREDLYFRLFSVEITVPPLRRRREDILPLALHFLEQTNLRYARNVAGFDTDVLDLFEQYQWPGNVRQLIREVERLVALTADNEIIRLSQCSSPLQEFSQIPGSNGGPALTSLSIPEHVTYLEKKLIEKAMKISNGNKSQAAKQLCLTRQCLAQKLKRYRLL
ncbi:MAG: sigma 54-interacting transcriptional regulator [Desulforhopalus sp.]|nr:sigma 54-interacting transcriptional regulator [Desulforhopalus sp.]